MVALAHPPDLFQSTPPRPDGASGARANVGTPGPKLARWLRAFPGARQSGRGWEAQCPAHDDEHPSLLFSEDEHGKVNFKCLRGDGCDGNAILERAGLTWDDVYPDRPRARAGRSWDDRIECAYDYREGGVLQYQVVRLRDPKDFTQRRPDPARPGRWLWRLGNVPRILYCLDALRAADPTEPVFTAEGEKDVDRLRAHGLVATTCPGGAEKWSPQHTAELRGRVVVILSDNDAKGHAHAEKVALALSPVAASLKVVALPDLPPIKGADVSDWLDAGHTVDELLGLVAETPPWEPPGLVAELARVTAERDAARATLSQVMAVVHRHDLSPADKVVGVVTIFEQRHYQATTPLAPDDPACSRGARALLSQDYALAPPQATVARAAGVSRSTVARTWERLGGLLDRQEASVRRREVDPATGEVVDEGWTKRTFLRLAGADSAAALSSLATAPVPAAHRQHGGARDVRPEPRCPACGDAGVDWHQVPCCRRCHRQLATEAAPAPVARMSQDATFEEATTTNTPPLSNEVTSVLQDATFGADPSLILAPAPPTRRCWTCRTEGRWWRRPDGSEWVCGACHPAPAALALAASA